MIRQLHLLTAPPDDWVGNLIKALQQDPSMTVEVVDLSGGAADYEQVVEAIFTADSIATW